MPCNCGDDVCVKCFPTNLGEREEDYSEYVKCMKCYNLVHESKNYCDDCEWKMVDDLLREERENEVEALLNVLEGYDEY